jgi:hypothetical protein
MRTKISRISKSQYIKGVQCPKALWYYRHRPDLKPEISEAQQHLFDTGHEIGELAKEYFKGGVEITAEYYEIDKAIESTDDAIRQGEDVIFEATALSPDGAFSRIDILKKVNESDAWDLIEVKASTGVRDYHFDDITFQRYAFANAGYKIRKSVLMHVNNQYVRSKELEISKLFTLENCTEIVQEKIYEINGNLKNLLKAVNSDLEPEIDIGDHCNSPFACDYIHHCWQHVPEYSIYNIFRGRKRDELLVNDIVKIADIPDNFETTERQYIDIRAFKDNQVYMDKDAIRGFLDTLIYPLYFLDYETIFPAIPLFDNTRPYQQVPFQFSLHIQEKKGGDLKHVEFLNTDVTDPRPDFIKSLIANCGDKGSVIVYNQSFESGINNQLSADFPEYSDRIDNITGRMVDLLVPFRSRWFYHPEMRGSASLKSVLPAFVPELSYDNLAIGDGGTASLMYLSCIKKLVDDKQKKQIFKDLIEYCAQDTLAEVELLKVLYRYS